METKKKSKSPAKKQLPKPKAGAEAIEDRLLVLRDENYHLKNRKIELEEDVRQ